jgi:hypothetical protein
MEVSLIMTLLPLTGTVLNFIIYDTTQIGLEAEAVCRSILQIEPRRGTNRSKPVGGQATKVHNLKNLSSTTKVADWLGQNGKGSY